MYFSQKRKSSGLAEGRDFKRYPDRLQMYKLPPTDNISLEEFEELAVERLKGTKYISIPKESGINERINSSQ